MSAASYPLRLERGVTLRRAFTVRNSDGTTIPLTGYTVTFRMRQSITSADHLVYTTPHDALVVNASQGTVTLTLSAEVTRTLALDPGGYYELDIISGSGEITRLVRGSLVFDRPLPTV